MEAAGILFTAGDKVLLLKRSNEGDHPREWGLPGGKIEEGETTQQAALRELQEECGVTFNGDLVEIGRSVGDVDFTTFMARTGEFKPKLNNEHTAYMWFDSDDLPNKIHPELRKLLDKVFPSILGRSDAQSDVLTEFDVAKQIRDGQLPSPQQFGNVWLYALRISGTGVSYRHKHDEFVYRDPALYASQEFLERCNGLPVILEHPETETLTTEEFKDRVIGTIILPYLNQEENAPWGIAKIYDQPAAEMMRDNQLSTSPSVVWKNKGINDTIELNDGKMLLIEGKPSLVDHLAICHQGVWDKAGPPSGVKLDQVEMTESSRGDSADSQGSFKGGNNMAEETPEVKKDSDGLDQILAMLKSIEGRLGQLEAHEAKELETMGADDDEKVEEFVDPEVGKHPKLADDDNLPSEELPVGGKPAPAPVAADKNDDDDDIRRRIDALEKSMPSQVSDDDYAAMADAQAKADSVYAAFGKSASRPLNGESLMAYRKRMLKGLQDKSATYAKVNIGKISDPAMLDIAEAQIFSDARVAAGDHSKMPLGTLREMRKKDVTGREIVEFIGDPSVAFAPFKMPKRSLIGINKH